MNDHFLIEISEQRISKEIIQSSQEKIAVKTDANCFYHWLHHRLHGSIPLQQFEQRRINNEQHLA